jgi:peptidoglycan/xylan/chitin deacetylase (PgdA/CDA1 family)
VTAEWWGPLALAPLRLLSRAGAILCYHGFSRGSGPGGPPLHVTLDEFRTAVAVARSLGRVVPVSDLVRRRREGRSTAGLFAFTFDDAYLSLSEVASEFIRSDAVPVTVFAIPTALDHGSTFWWDRLDALVPHLAADDTRTLLDRCGVPDHFRRRHAHGFGPERPLRQWILARHRGRCPTAILEVLAEREQETGARAPDRSMTWSELNRFLELPSVELGVHTLTHPVLRLLPEPEQRREIGEAFDRLRERFALTRPILAAPFGQLDAATVAAARRSGMQATLSLRATTLDAGEPADVLPRFCILARERPLKLALRVAGLSGRLRRARGQTEPTYPPLPSAAPADRPGSRAIAGTDRRRVATGGAPSASLRAEP